MPIKAFISEALLRGFTDMRIMEREKKSISVDFHGGGNNP